MFFKPLFAAFRISDRQNPDLRNAKVRALGAWGNVRVTGPVGKNPPCTGFVGAKLFAARLDEIWDFPETVQKFDG
jgi:hypothetical protein